ncbi:Cupredoxin [Exidia glandulosa HHB12029]|uniref:Cupredoxin n=1 Tax=Exidia glandulosa HHB12029 TaxID=1314781 RepID=A0A165K8R4_EXIGL|nr:Cupredoxin [Exidia glandulosa HHB12029]
MLAFSRFTLVSSLVASALAAEFTVKVGADGLAFTPNQVTAVAGDVVIFEFHAKNHTLTQSTLAAPCSPVAGGGDSGFIPVAADATTFPTKRLTVPDATTPLWFYCKQGNHCASGMVFAINPGSQTKMDTFIANAKGLAAPATGTTAAPATGATTTAAPAASTPATGGTTATTGSQIVIEVGNGGLTFTPDRATAKKGDTIIFHFAAGNHTVTQSTFAAPCAPMAGGADSGFMPVAQLANPNFTFVVPDDSKPLWMFCKQGKHCQSGMVFSLNAPPTGNTADAFKAAAMGTAGATTATNGTTTTDPNAPETIGGTGAASRVASGVTGLLLASVLAGLLL